MRRDSSRHRGDAALLKIGAGDLDHAGILKLAYRVIDHGLVTDSGHLEHAGDCHGTSPSRRCHGIDGRAEAALCLLDQIADACLGIALDLRRL